MKVLLVNPPFYRLRGLMAPNLPLGLAYLASSIIQDNDVVIYNADLGSEQGLDVVTNRNAYLNQETYEKALVDTSNYVWDEIRRTIEMVAPDVVGITVMSCKFTQASIISKIAKNVDSAIRVVWGGPHPSADPVNSMQENVDFVLVKEGEIAFRKLLQHLRGSLPIDQVGNLLYRVDGGVVQTNQEPYISNLDEVAFPARELDLNSSLYGGANFVDVIGSRGCPFGCTYCSSRSIWSRSVRYRSAENILAELVSLKSKHDVKTFSFVDDTFTLDTRRALEFCRALIKSKLNISWTCTTRMDVLNEELVCLMKESGLSIVTVGVESGSERVLQLIEKGLTKVQVRKGAELLDKHGIDWHAFFMTGFPYETREDIQETRDFIGELRPTTVELSVFTPYPGSRIYEQARSMGVIPDKPEWSLFSHQSQRNQFVGAIPKDEFAEIVKDFFNEVEAYNNSWRNLARKLYRRRKQILVDPATTTRSIINAVKRKL